MKRALAGVLAAAFIGLTAAGAAAQVSFFQVFFDDASNGSYGETQYQGCGPLLGELTLYVVAFNCNTFVSAVDYQVQLPPSLLYSSESYPVVPGGSLNIGDSFNGNAISYGFPRNGFDPMLLTTITTLWTGQCDCGTPGPIVVGGYPGKTAPSVVSWPSFTEFGSVGMTSLICPGPVAVEEKTWGGIKALYR
jgi:hypothetical protein